MLRLIALAVLVHVGIGLLVERHGPTGMDRVAFDALDPIESPDGKDGVRVLTEIGSYPVVAVVALLAAVFAARAGRTRDAVALVLGTLVLLLVVGLTKQIWDRPRPVDRFYDPHGHSYPSGHSAYAIVWLAAARATGRRGLMLLAVLVGVTIGVSRLYLHVHYLTDVLGGFALGAAILAPVLARKTP